MPNVIKIKRSQVTATPASLAEGELAYSENSDNLFIGKSGDNVAHIGGLTAMNKLNGIEANATADQTGAEIKAAYEGEANTNAFTDTEKTKLSGIEDNADVTDATNVAAAGAVMNTGDETVAGIKTFSSFPVTPSADPTSNYQVANKKYVDDEVAAVAAGGTFYKGGYDAATNTPDLDTSPSGVGIGNMYTVTVAGTFFTTDVEVGDVLIAEADDATTEAEWTIVQANLTPATIKSQYESNSDTNAFTDAEQTKLSGIEALADVTDATNIAAAGGLLDTSTIDGGTF